MTTKETKANEVLKFDVRVIEMRMRRGEIDPKDYEALLKKLPNDEEKAEYLEVWEEKSQDEKTPHSDALTFTSA